MRLIIANHRHPNFARCASKEAKQTRSRIASKHAVIASPDFVARWLSQGVTAYSLSRAPSLVFDQKDRLQKRCARRVLRREVTLPAHRLPSSAAFVEATVRGIGWALNPRPLIERQLQDGTLVELIPNRALDVPLYWQWSSMSAPPIEALTTHVMNAAKQSLTLS